MNFNNFVDISKSLLDKVELQNKHFSFILLKNRIRSIGYNQLKTHPKAYKFGYPWLFQHSEVSAIVRFDGKPAELRNCCLVNVRLNKDGQIMQSRPCKNCLNLVSEFGFKKVFYTNRLGEFCQL